MKILMTADPIGGVWTHTMDLCQCLREHGIEVAMATMGAELSDSQRRQLADAPNVRLFASRYKLEWMDDPWEDVAAAGRWLLSIRDAFQPDLVHLNGYAHGSLPWDCPVVITAHSCVLSWWEAVKGESAPAEYDRYRREVKMGLAAAGLVAAPTAAMLGSVQRLYGPLPRTSVIYGGRDPLLYRSGAKEPFVLSAGRLWDEAKNLAVLEEASGKVVWPVLVAGDGVHPGGSCVQISQVRFVGKLSAVELALFYARAAIYALPAKYEPFGLSVLEAALSSCALVLGDIASLREVWGNAAIYVDPHRAESVAWAINSLTGNHDYLREMGHRAHQRAMRYSPSRMAEQYLQGYWQLLGRDIVTAAEPARLGDCPLGGGA